MTTRSESKKTEKTHKVDNKCGSAHNICRYYLFPYANGVYRVIRWRSGFEEEVRNLPPSFDIAMYLKLSGRPLNYGEQQRIARTLFYASKEKLEKIILMEKL